VTAVTVLSGTVPFLTRPAGADAISDARAKAAAIEAQLAQDQNEMSALGQQFDEARDNLTQIKSNIASTKASITTDRKQVAHDKHTLAKAAVANYITDGTAAAANPIFSGNASTLGAQTEYNQVAEGNINLAVDNLHTAENALNAHVNQLQGEQSQAQAQVNQEQQAIAQNQQVMQQQQAALNQEQGQIAVLVRQQQEAEAAAAARAAEAKIAAARAAAQQASAAQAAAQAAAEQSASASSTSTSTTTGNSGGGSSVVTPPNPSVAPPSASGGEGAVQAAESQIGVPYVWGGETPRSPGNQGGFDCSGLTAWSWGQVGVPLPHYSGAQMSDSTPVPISDLQPGDLLFYGPGGSDHVAMYVGPGTMIEAPHTGASVWITGLRLGDGFVGAGRP
jgi:peptidoglycan DL-endopeptidase CwlO